MKKFLKIFGLIIVIFIGCLIAIPYFFKDSLVEKVKDEANKHINAKLSFDDVDLTFFSHFPKLSFELSNFKLEGIDNFEGIELLSIEQFGLSVELGSLLSGDIPSISELYIDGANVNALVHPSGAANWDIVKVISSNEEESGTVEEVEEDSNFNLQVQYYRISKSRVFYNDESTNTHLLIEDLNHTGSGDFGMSDFTLFTQTEVGNLLFEYDHEVYVDNWKLGAKINLDVNMDRLSFVLSDNEIRINELLLKADGEVAMPDTSIHLDLNIEAPSLDLRQLISLTPPSYSSDLDGYTFGGQSSLNVWIKGAYNYQSYPLFGLDVSVSDGSFHYSDLPKSVEDVEIALHVESPDSRDLDKLWIDMSKFTMNMGSNPFSLGFSLRQPMSSMDFKARLSAAIDFETLKDVFPPEAYAIHKGSLRANLQADGSLSELEQEVYENLNASGKLQILDLDYTENINIPKALLNFEMDRVELESFEAKIGRNDLSADGNLENFIPYALYDKKLTGELNLRSQYLNINELTDLLLGDSASESVQASSPDSTSIASSPESTQGDTITEMFPKNIHFSLRTGVNELVYDDITLKEFQGDMDLEEGVLTLSSCSAKTLGGEMKLSGVIDETIPGKPYANMRFRVKNMGIEESAAKIELLNQYFPIAKYTKGTYSGDINLDSYFDKEWNPVYESVYSKGKVRTKSVKIEGFKVLDDFATITKTESVLDNEFENMDISYEIIDGKGYIKPFDFKLDEARGNAYGSIDLEQKLDFDVHMNVPTEMLGDGANQLLGQIAGALSGFGLETDVPETIAMDIKVTGTVEKPKIVPNFSGVQGETVKEVVKEKIEEEIDKAKEEALARAKEEADKILADARKEADKLLKEAEKNIAIFKKEGYAQADKLVEDANGFIEKAAAKIAASEAKKQIDKQAENLMKEAREEADKILRDAQKQADRIQK